MPDIKNDTAMVQLEGKSLDNLNQPHIAKFYCNAIGGGHSTVDIYMVLARNGMPFAVVNMPVGTARELHKMLGTVIDSFENLPKNE